tara:strand:- start:1636 stop:2121 length:486 start_codon:yes stop_codon:yes gene_type:complete
MHKRGRNKLIKNFIFGIFSISINIIFSQLMWGTENKVYKLPIIDIEDNFESTKLKPIPKGDVNFSSKQVNFYRNPFQNISDADSLNIDDLNLTIDLKGIAFAENKVMAIIETNNEQRFYKVGESMTNGFLITGISIKDEAVDITNGIKNYRLIMSDIRKSL